MRDHEWLNARHDIIEETRFFSSYSSFYLLYLESLSHLFLRRSPRCGTSRSLLLFFPRVYILNHRLHATRRRQEQIHSSTSLRQSFFVSYIYIPVIIKYTFANVTVLLCFIFILSLSPAPSLSLSLSFFLSACFTLAQFNRSSAYLVHPSLLHSSTPTSFLSPADSSRIYNYVQGGN